MTKRKEKPSEVKNAFVVWEFEKLVADYTLDDVFYPREEYLSNGYGIGSTLLAGPLFHPLHPDFTMPELHRPSRIGLLGMYSSSSSKKPIPVVVNTENLRQEQQKRVALHVKPDKRVELRRETFTAQAA